MSATAPLQRPLPIPVWQEVGRPSHGDVQDWTTWVSPLGWGSDALYRSLVFVDGTIAVTVDLHAISGTRTIHRGLCGLPQDPERTAERVRLLLAADKAVASGVGQQSVGQFG